MEISVNLFYVSCEVLKDQSLLLALFAQSHIERLDAEIACKGDWAIDVVAKCFK